jgi:ribosomal protein S18 acetylase RimI-like enzyme
MLIKRAVSEDYPALEKIRDAFVLTPSLLGKEKSAKDYSKNGFLLGDYSEKTFLKDLNKIFIVAKSESGLLGYLRVDNEVDKDFKKMDEHGDINWTNQEYKKSYYQNPHFEIGAILVDSKFQNQGVGNILIDYAFASIISEIPKSQDIVTIFSFIMMEPIGNEASLRFHTKNGFIQVAELKPCDLFGFKGYKSILLAKEIKRSNSKKWE